MRYRLFDFTLDSDTLLPELDPDPEGEPALVLKHANPCALLAHGHAVDRGRRSWPTVARSGATYLVAFADELTLLYSPGRVDWGCSGGASLNHSARHTLLDQALPLIAAHEGRMVIHAACAIRGRRAVLFAGPAGRGKSTLVAHLVANGWQYAADDAVALHVRGETVLACPSYRGLRLWPDAAEAVGYPETEVSILSSGKRRFASEPLPAGDFPLHAVYCISASNADGRPRARALSAREAFVALLRNSYVLDPTDNRRAGAQLEALSAIATRVSAWSLAVPRCYAALADVRTRIERDTQVPCD